MSFINTSTSLISTTCFENYLQEDNRCARNWNIVRPCTAWLIKLQFLGCLFYSARVLVNLCYGNKLQIQLKICPLMLYKIKLCTLHKQPTVIQQKWLFDAWDTTFLLRAFLFMDVLLSTCLLFIILLNWSSFASRNTFCLF